MSRETATLETLETLDRRIAELASFVSPSEIFRALLEGTVVGAPSAAIFLMREGQWKGWSSIGYSAASAQTQRRTTAPADSGWLAALAAEEDVRWRSLMPGENVPDFGQPHATEAVGLPVRVGGKAVAILIAGAPGRSRGLVAGGVGDTLSGCPIAARARPRLAPPQVPDGRERRHGCGHEGRGPTGHGGRPSRSGCGRIRGGPDRARALDRCLRRRGRRRSTPRGSPPLRPPDRHRHSALQRGGGGRREAPARSVPPSRRSTATRPRCVLATLSGSGARRDEAVGRRVRRRSSRAATPR